MILVPGDVAVIVSGLAMAGGWVAAFALGLSALRRPDRRWGVAGLALASASVAAFVILLNVAG